MSEEHYPREYSGDALRSLRIDPRIGASITRITVASSATMIIKVRNKSITVDVQRPIAEGRSWTIRVEITQAGAAAVVVAAEAHAISAVNPTLPDPSVVEAAVVVAEQAAFARNREAVILGDVVELLGWMVAPGTAPADALATLAVMGKVTVGIERAVAGDTITLRIDAGHWSETLPERLR